MQSSKEEQEEVKKGFLSERCKEGKTTQGDRNGGDPTGAEDVKKRCPEHTEELNKKDLHDTDNLYGVITHLEPDILECEVK